MPHELNRAGIAGVRFVPVRFTPDASVFKGKPCAGVQILLTDRDRAQVVDIGITVARTLHRLYPAEFGLDKFNRLLAHPGHNRGYPGRQAGGIHPQVVGWRAVRIREAPSEVFALLVYRVTWPK